MEKKLYRIEEGKKISGVCMGIGAYLGIDVTLIRLLWVVLFLFTAGFGGIILYIACIFIIPEEPNYIDAKYTEK